MLTETFLLQSGTVSEYVIPLAKLNHMTMKASGSSEPGQTFGLNHSKKLEKVAKSEEFISKDTYMADLSKVLFTGGQCRWCGGYTNQQCRRECEKRGWRCYRCMSCTCRCSNNC